MKSDEIMLALRTNDSWPPEMETLVEWLIRRLVGA